MNDKIKIDGHIFIDKYIKVNAIEPNKEPVSVAIGCICEKCTFYVNCTIKYIKENGMEHIFLEPDYLSCNKYMIKKLLG